MLAYLKNEGLGGLQDDETVEDVIDTIFQGQDKNEDNMISHDEFSGPKHDEFWWHVCMLHLCINLFFILNEVEF